MKAVALHCCSARPWWRAPAWAPGPAAGLITRRRASTSRAIDRSTKPGDDFFQYANGKYLAARGHPGRPADGVAPARNDRPDGSQPPPAAPGRGAAASAEQPADNRGKAGAFYTAFMDEAAIEPLGVAAIAPELDAIRSASSPSASSSALMGQSASDFYPAIVAPYVDSDLKAPDRYAIYLNQSGLGLPDRDYYLKPDFAPQRAGLCGLCHPIADAARLGRSRRRPPAALDRVRNADRRRQLGQGQAARPDHPV